MTDTTGMYNTAQAQQPLPPTDVTTIALDGSRIGKNRTLMFPKKSSVKLMIGHSNEI